MNAVISACLLVADSRERIAGSVRRRLSDDAAVASPMTKRLLMLAEMRKNKYISGNSSTDQTATT